MSRLTARIGAQHPFTMALDPRRSPHRRVLCGLIFVFGLLVYGGGEAAQQSAGGSPAVATRDAGAAPVQPEELRMWMTVGERRFALTLTDNAAARTFAELLPLTLDMPDLNANEKHVGLPKDLPTNASRPGTIRTGDLMLYGSNTLVLFYKTFDSSYSYTRLGRVNDPSGLAQVLGPRGVRIVFSKD
jgi:hypothetical protein